MPRGGVNVPFVPGVYEPNSTIAEMIMRAGQQQAQSQREMYGGLANTIGQLGQIPAQIAEQKAMEARTKLEESRAKREEARIQQQDEATKAKAERDAKFSELLKQGEPDPKSVLDIYGPEDGLKLLQGLHAYRELDTKKGPEAVKSLPNLVRAMDAVSEPFRAELYPAIRQKVVATGLIPPDQASQVLPEQYDPARWPEISKMALALEKPQEQKAPSYQHVETAGGVQAFDPTKGTLGPVLAPGKKPEPKEPKLHAVQTVDEQGNAVTSFISEADAQAMAAGKKPGLKKPPSTAVQNRQTAAKSSIQSGEAILKSLQDPKVQAEIGAFVGRYNSLAAAAGAGEPIAQKLVGEIKSFAALQPQIHGFRAHQMAKDIEGLLSTKQSPEALAAALQGILSASYIVGEQGPGGTSGKLKFNPATGAIE